MAGPGMFVWAGPSHHVAQTCHIYPFVLSNKKLLATAPFVEHSGQCPDRPSWAQPCHLLTVTQVFTAPCEHENLQGKFGFFDIFVLPPPSSPAPIWPPLSRSLPPSPLCPKGFVRKWEGGTAKSQKRPLMSRCPALPCPALSPALVMLAPTQTAGSRLAHALSCDMVAQGVYMFCTSADNCT